MQNHIHKNMHKDGQARIFRSDFLEALTKTNPTQNIIIYGLVVLGFIYTALFIKNISFLTFVITFIVALFSWTLIEYLLHRFLFHFVNEHPFIKRFHFIMHGSHHLYPKDEERLLMPPAPGLILAAIFFGIFYCIFLIIGFPVLTWAYFPGFFLGYLLYSFVHRATHIYKPPKGFERLWIHHSLHHYKYPNKCFGVSNTFWDRVFGTMPPKQFQ